MFIFCHIININAKRLNNIWYWHVRINSVMLFDTKVTEFMHFQNFVLQAVQGALFSFCNQPRNLWLSYVNDTEYDSEVRL